MKAGEGLRAVIIGMKSANKRRREEANVGVFIISISNEMSAIFNEEGVKAYRLAKAARKLAAAKTAAA